MIEPFKKISGESAREFVVRTLKTSIINLTLKPGQNVSEKEIADELGVSRTPVREALIKLAQEELVEIYPQRGTYISLIDLDIVEEANFLRVTLEKVIVKLACQTMTDKYIMALEENLKLQEFYAENKNSLKLLEIDNQFHRIIFKACKKERTFSLMESINTHFNRVRMLRLAANINLDKVLSQHREILAAIKEKNSEQAEQAMELHLDSRDIETVILKEQYPDYFKK
jgi:DNA-binding GntR family transcriptional regulator